MRFRSAAATASHCPSQRLELKAGATRSASPPPRQPDDHLHLVVALDEGYSDRLRPGLGGP
jgi:hypothetical protein